MGTGAKDAGMRDFITDQTSPNQMVEGDLEKGDYQIKISIKFINKLAEQLFTEDNLPVEISQIMKSDIIDEQLLMGRHSKREYFKIN